MNPQLVIKLPDGRVQRSPLKAGINRIGRIAENDVSIPDPSVSSKHAEILVTSDSIEVRDLGSTNGTYIDGQLVQQANVSPGQNLQFGNVQIQINTVESAQPSPHSPIRVQLKKESPVVASASSPVIAAPSTRTALKPVAPGQAVTGGPASLPPGYQNAHCKFHPRVEARLYCAKCGHYLCDMCADSDTAIPDGPKQCKACGSTCMSWARQAAVVAPKKPGFFSQVPGAFAYPFRGSGVMVLVGVTIFLALLDLLQFGVIGIILQVASVGYLFLYLQGIIHTTACGDKELPDPPGLDDLLLSCGRLVGTVLLSFGPAFALDIAHNLEQPIPHWLITSAYVFGYGYFPMAFLEVAIKDNVLAAIPLAVIPSIAKTWLTYLPMTALLLLVYFAAERGDQITGDLMKTSVLTKSMFRLVVLFALTGFWYFVSIYVLTVSVRILGIFYTTHKERLDW